VSQRIGVIPLVHLSGAPSELISSLVDTGFPPKGKIETMLIVGQILRHDFMASGIITAASSSPTSYSSFAGGAEY